MIKPITFVRQDHCPICNTKNSIECYDTRDRPIRFTKVLDLVEKDILYDLEYREFSHMKCKKCNKIFMLDWSDRNIPKPLVYKHILYELLDNYY